MLTEPLRAPVAPVHPRGFCGSAGPAETRGAVLTPKAGGCAGTAGSIPAPHSVKGKAGNDVTLIPVTSAPPDASASIQGAQLVPRLPMLYVERCSTALVLLF